MVRMLIPLDANIRSYLSLIGVREIAELELSEQKLRTLSRFPPLLQMGGAFVANYRSYSLSQSCLSMFTIS